MKVIHFPQLGLDDLNEQTINSTGWGNIATGFLTATDAALDIT